MAKRLFEDVCSAIRREIAAGTLKAGDKLAPERQLAKDLNVGRPVVREALRSLEEAGILEFRLGVTGGAFIRVGDHGSVARSFNDLVFLGAVTLDDVSEARSCVLSYTAQRAAERGSSKDFEALEQNIAETEHIYDDLSDEEKVSYVGYFYELLAKAAHNEALIVLIRSLSPLVTQVLLKTRPNNLPAVLASRRRLLGHLRAGHGAAAAQELIDHLSNMHEVIVEHAASLHDLELYPLHKHPHETRRTRKNGHVLT